MTLHKDTDTAIEPAIVPATETKSVWSVFDNRPAKGVFWSVLMFAAVGTISALWPNPLFVRMTPAGDFEIILLLAMSAFFGGYMAVRRPACSTRMAYGGGILGFIGVACPVCNKILLLVFGGELLMVYFEPIRIYVALAGVLMMAAALWFEVRRQGAEQP